MRDNKEVICWGTGRIAERILSKHPELNPGFFVDIDKEKRRYRGKTVFRPEEITNLKDYYVVIMIKNYREVAEYLDAKGLRQGENYDVYYDALELFVPVDFNESINEIKVYKRKCINDIRPAVLFFPYGDSVRKPEIWHQFLKKHFSACGIEKYVTILYGASDANEDKMLEAFGCRVFGFPATLGDSTIKQALSVLSKQEINYLDTLINRKTNYIKQDYYYYLRLIEYYKRVIEELDAEKVLILSGWNIDNYLLKFVAEQKGIRFGVFEFGWIPGTIQVDPCGVIGQGECAQHPEIIQKVSVTNDDIQKVQAVKEFVIQNKVDSRDFVLSETDEIQLKKLDKTKKTVFVVGMNESGNSTVNGSDYWKKVLSSTFDSMREALEECISICRKNGWNLIFKPHPDDTTFAGDDDRYDGIIFIRNMPVDDLIEMSDVMVSMSSTTEYRALMYNKPVVQVGITSLNHMGCTYKVDDKKELESVLMDALENGMTIEQKNNFDILLARLMKKYLWDDLQERPLRYGLPADVDFLDT